MRKKIFLEVLLFVADGAYSGEENSRLASEHNLKTCYTNFTGRKPDEIYADFVFTDDGKYLINVRIIVYLKTVSMIQAMSVPLRIFG